MQLREAGMCAPGGGLHAPVAPLFPSSSTLGGTYQELSQMETVCIGANNGKISSGLSNEQIFFSKEQGLLFTVHDLATHRDGVALLSLCLFC